MLVKRFEDAAVYEAPNHRLVVGLRLQGFEEGGPTNQWIGFSQFLPGGGAGPDQTPFEKVYVVLEGEMTVYGGRGRGRAGTDGQLHNRPRRGARNRQPDELMSARCWSSFPIPPRCRHEPAQPVGNV